MKKHHHILDRIDRSSVLLGFFFLLGAILITQLFILQVISHAKYKQIAAKEHYGYSEIPAYRGEIFIKDYGSGDLVRVATNTTLDLLFADPSMIKDKKLVADRIVPLIYDPEEAMRLDEARVKTVTLRATSAEELETIKAHTEDELYQNFYNDLLEKISSDLRPMIILSGNLNADKLTAIKDLNIKGLLITENGELRAYPPEMDNIRTATQLLSTILETPALELETLLKGKNRYVILMKKLKPEISTKIKELVAQDEGDNFNGLGLQEEYYRYYPEKNLASNVIGFLSPDGNGTYGIEARFNTELKGKKGVFETQKDSIGRLITVGDSLIQPAQDGENIVLTLDRSIQTAIEKNWKER